MVNEENELKYYAEVCKLSYKEKEKFLSESELYYKLDIYTPSFIERDNAFCFVYKHNKKLVITIRGTNDSNDAMDNIKIARTHYSSSTGVYCGKIHSGFIEYYENVRDNIRKKIVKYIESKDETKEEKGIVFCGHSLGSAACCIAALDSSYLANCPKIKVFSYGSPRVGDKEFSKQFNKRIECFRVVNQNDPVTKIPFPFRFTHVKKEIFLKEKNYFWNIFHKTGLLFTGKMGVLYEDHNLDKYIEKL
jgi:triacylglycerol lipase